MTTDPVQTVLDALQAAGRKVKPIGRDKWQFQCLAHDDNQASGSLGRGDDGRALVHCFAGCTPQAIVEALGLRMKDLMAGTCIKHTSRTGRDGKPEIVAHYDYTDEGGNLLYQVVRFMPKDFRQRRPDGSGGWIWKMEGVRRVLYRLPELLEHPDLPVWIVEGEKDVEALRSRGFLATCNVGGAGKWRPEYGEHLRGRTCYIIGDNDEPGRKHARQVFEALQGVAASVRIVQMPTAIGGQP